MCSEKTIVKLFSHEPAIVMQQLLWTSCWVFLGDLLYYSRLRDSIEFYDINCKQN